MGKASHRNGGTGCGSSELPVWCTSCHRKDTSLDLLRRNMKQSLTLYIHLIMYLCINLAKSIANITDNGIRAKTWDNITMLTNMIP